MATSHPRRRVLVWTLALVAALVAAFTTPTVAQAAVSCGASPQNPSGHITYAGQGACSGGTPSSIEVRVYGQTAALTGGPWSDIAGPTTGFAANSVYTTSSGCAGLSTYVRTRVWIQWVSGGVSHLDAATSAPLPKSNFC